jgi:hypothetical protein
MCFCPDESPEFAAQTRPRARKAHRCVECRRTIAVGEVYVREASKWEGEVSASVFCIDCHEWATALCAAQQLVCGCSGWLLGDLWCEIREFTREHLGYSPDVDDDDETWVGQLAPELGGPKPTWTGSVVMS